MIKLTGRAENPSDIGNTLTLTYDQRTRSRQRVTLDDGSDAGIFLERGTTLRDGDVLRSDDGYTVVVRAARERISTLRCTDALLLARACYHLGNRHVPLEITPRRLRYKHDHVLDAMLHGLGFEVLVEDATFEPEPGAYGGGQGAHHHAH